MMTMVESDMPPFKHSTIPTWTDLQGHLRNILCEDFRIFHRDLGRKCSEGFVQLIFLFLRGRRHISSTLTVFVQPNGKPIYIYISQNLLVSSSTSTTCKFILY